MIELVVVFYILNFSFLTAKRAKKMAILTQNHISINKLNVAGSEFHTMQFLLYIKHLSSHRIQICGFWIKI